mmetsp:Transcript_148601/g.475826  ORF Transcript_148601/g.475826 Transcript_148601/m.475826 type:complete len:169 (-) Transcript_148601:13-519(-)
MLLPQRTLRATAAGSTPTLWEDAPPTAGGASGRAGTMVLHLRSNILRLRSNPSTFKASNRMLAEVLAPLVARSLAEDPLVLPTLADVRAAEGELRGAVADSGVAPRAAPLAAAGAGDMARPAAPRAAADAVEAPRAAPLTGGPLRDGGSGLGGGGGGGRGGRKRRRTL